MHICSILDEPEHQVTFLKGPGFNPAAMITMQILLLYRRTSRRQVTLLIQEVEIILTFFFVISFDVSRHMGRIVTDVTGKNRLRSVNHEEWCITRGSVGGSIDTPKF